LPFSLIGYAIIAFSMLVLAILGVNDMVLIKFTAILAAVMFIPMLLMIFGKLAQDTQRQLSIDQESEAISRKNQLMRWNT